MSSPAIPPSTPTLGDWPALIGQTFVQTIFDVLPIVVVLLFFQIVVLRRPLANPARLAFGMVYVIAGLSLFLVGLDTALFPLGRIMAAQLTSPQFTGALTPAAMTDWSYYGWVYAFAFCMGFATTLAEPSLIAVGLKAQDVSGGTIKAGGLRLAVALGVASGVALGCWRIVAGTPMMWIIASAYGVVIVQTLLAPKAIIPLAYDSGGVSTSTVTVPLVTALGLGLASAIPGRSPLLDGFGLIALACLFPMITVMGYAQLGVLMTRFSRSSAPPSAPDSQDPPHPDTQEVP